MDSLDGRVSLIFLSDRRLFDVVAGNSGHQRRDLLPARGPVNDGERDDVETTGDVVHFAIVHSQELRHKPAGQSIF